MILPPAALRRSGGFFSAQAVRARPPGCVGMARTAGFRTAPTGDGPRGSMSVSISGEEADLTDIKSEPLVNSTSELKGRK